MRMGKSSIVFTLASLICLFVIGFGVVVANAAEEVADPLKDKSGQALDERKALDQEVSKRKRPVGVAELIASLPEDDSPVYQVSEIRITGNELLSSGELLGCLPAVYDSSTADSAGPIGEYLYDFRGLGAIVADPGKSQGVSAWSIKGLTEYILSVYTGRGYGGIYVYVPSEAFGAGKELKGGIVPIQVIEAKVSDVGVQSYDVDGERAEKGRLSHDALLSWSPVRKGEVMRRKKLDDMVNLLNRNPDRYMSAVVSRGSEPDTLSVNYDVYEANPWHFFGQIDNAGTKDRQWTPRFGIINTNTFGFDDILTLMYQTPFDSRAGDQYSAFGSYDFPLLGPRLRLNLFGGYNEFDIDGTGDVDFLGRGHFYGGTLRLNVFQANRWFFDVTGTLQHLESKITRTLNPFQLQWGTDVGIDQWGMGVEIYRTDDMTDTKIALQRFDSYDGSNDGAFSDARTGAKSNFSIYTAAVGHSRFLDPDKIQNLSGSFRYVTSDERLHPSQMTAFGGMYSVRGYDEYEIIADGGILASIQYEYDLIKHGQAQMRKDKRGMEGQDPKPFVRKLAPLVFFDYGQARIEDADASETSDRELASWGFGTKVELGDNFTGVVYYGYPLIKTERTREGKGRINVGLLYRF
jgi:hemolysin activation/secretion protein